METSPEILERFLQRERIARKEAERLLEERSRQLYQSNVGLKSAARALREEAERSKAIFDTAAEGIMIINELGDILSLNTAAIKIFGLENCNTDKLNISHLLPEFCEGDTTCNNQLKQFVLQHGEVEGLKCDGTTIPLELAVSEFTHENVRNFTAIVRDLSRRKMLESQLSHAQKMESVGQLAAGIAHEINTPIQYVGDNTRFLQTSFESIEQILKSVELLCESADAPERVQELIRQMKNDMEELDLDFLRSEIPPAVEQTLHGAESVARIVRAMKEFSHPGSEESQEINLNQAVESTLTVSKSEWKYCADLSTDFDLDLPPVRCLPGELNQALLNVIINAAHAIAEKNENSRGNLFVSTSREGDMAVIKIGDSGNGIPDSIRARIFDPFFTTKGVGKGTGQGLAITYNVIVDKHQGQLTFESETGVGTTFILKLPIAGCTPAVAEEKRSNTATPAQ